MEQHMFCIHYQTEILATPEIQGIPCLKFWRVMASLYKQYWARGTKTPISDKTVS